MIPLAVGISVFAVAGLVYVTAQSRRRTVAELLADALYAMAAITYSAAVAVDAAIVTYRRERARIKAEHVPQYAARVEETL